MRKMLLAFLLLISLLINAQDEKEKAYDLGLKAIAEMDTGNIEIALDLLDQAEKLDPENINYPYEIAYAHYLDKNYKKSIKVLEDLLTHDQVNDRVYQMLGNSHDMNKDPEKAISVYEEGIKKFPKSGALYLERGNMEMLKEDYNSALSFYEKGIEIQADFPSNYYWASKIYLSSTEEVWGMIYAEIFMNLERSSKRTSEISKKLYDTYSSEIKFGSDTSFSVSFSQNATIDIEDSSQFKLPFGIGVYEPTLMFSLINEKEISLASLNRVRTNFINIYYKNAHHQNYPNLLFDYQKKLGEEGHAEAYNYWILMKGDETAFENWLKENEEKWESFISWFTENQMEVNEKNKFFTSQY